MSDPTNGFTPPPPPPIVSGGRGSGGPSGPRRNSTVIVATIAVAVLVIAGAVIGVFALNRDDTVEAVAVAVTLDGAVDAGNDPFLAAPDLTEVAAFPETVKAVAEQSRASMTTDASTGSLTVIGTNATFYGGRQDAAPGLYGGSGEETVCDTKQLALYLAGDQAKAVAWSGARGIAPAQITDYLLTLTPVTLLSDTVVTNYGFAGGAATPRQSVLQAGTAVLVDSTGLPVVRCACGNPLAAPTVTNLPSAEFLGTRWERFDPARSVLVTAGSVVSSFALVDLTTGVSFDRTVGATVASPNPVSTPPVADGPRTIVVVDSSQDSAGKLRGVVSASTNGIDWTTMLTTPVPLSGVAHGDGLTVVVGGDEAGGTTLSTQNGTQWTDPVAVPDALQKVAYGDGTWMAVGVSSTQAEGASGVIYTSQDAVTWTPGDDLPHLRGDDHAVALVHRNGRDRNQAGRLDLPTRLGRRGRRLRPLRYRHLLHGWSRNSGRHLHR